MVDDIILRYPKKGNTLLIAHIFEKLPEIRFEYTV